MSESPKSQPASALSLRRLRDEAKARTRAGEFARLADAQFAIAREHGFPSWPRLKTYVETRALDIGERAAALVRSACSSDLRTARILLAAEPDLAGHDLATACVTGSVADVATRIARDPHVVHRPTGPLSWQPLLYACFSRFLRARPIRSAASGGADAEIGAGIVAVVRTLLDAGADPNVMWFDGEFRQVPIYGAAGIANHPELTRMLLDAGADPNETYESDAIGEALYHAAEFPDVTCARLLIEAGTTPARVSYCLARALDFPDPAMTLMFLEHGAQPTARHLRTAVFRGRPVRTIRALLDAGAPVDKAGRNRLTPLRIAVRWGRTDVADLLVSRGADPSLVTDTDRVIGAIVAGPPGTTPGSVDTAVPPAEMLDWAAHIGDVDMIRRLLAAGASVDGAGDLRPMSQAAWRGHADVVRELLARGAQLTWHDGSAIGAALHGAAHCHDPQAGPTMRTADEVDHGDYAEVVRILLAAGAAMPDHVNDTDLDGLRERLAL